ncbi:MAG: hypothetical protein HXX10_16740 [Rhodoplanes sp.]|uniref:hypothetical protein n=1 Tax=Rhodoplanes sp. TaxID=1968906 RepID=UPI00181E527B|nr:hypothetical protein [Rhodoplanes sp.]NVO15681.1 hypothetical protein [Rhodoplanes sp.]
MPAIMTSRARRGSGWIGGIVVPLGLMLATFASLIVLYRTGQPPLPRYLYDSDALYLPTLFSDILLHGGRISDWYLTPAPYFFPDFILYFLAFSLGSDIYLSILLFSLIQITVLFIALNYLLEAFLEGRQLLLASVATVLLVWLSVNGGVPFVFVLSSGFHFSVAISAVVLAGLWLRICDQDDLSKTKGLMAAACSLSFLLSLSDDLFLVQVLVPFIGALAVFGLCTREVVARRCIAAIGPAAFGLLGSLSYPYVVANPTRYRPRIDIQGIPTKMVETYSVFAEVIGRFPPAGVLLVAYAVLLVWVLAATIGRRRVDQASVKVVWLIVFSLLSSACAVLVVLISSGIVATSRYYIPVFVWPIIVGVVLIGTAAKHGLVRLFTLVASLAVVSLVASAWSRQQERGLASGHYPDEIACIDRALEAVGLRNGIAGYWDAKHIQAFSRQSITLAQYTEHLDEFRWITSGASFRSSYDFAIISENEPTTEKIPRRALIAAAGAPENEVACGERILLVYGRDRLRLSKRPAGVPEPSR